MAVRAVACLVLLALPACDGLISPDRAAPLAYDGQHFRATIRKDVSSNKLTPTPGVTLYDFHVGSLPLVFMYVGDKPGYPHFAWTPESEQDSTLASGLASHCRYGKQDSGAARECLIALSEESPTRLHVWYEQKNAKWAQAADAIIASIKPP